MPLNFFTPFMQELFKYRIRVPSKFLPDLDKLIDKALIGDSNIWNQQVVTFSTGNGGDAKSFQVLTNKDNYCNKINIIVVLTDTEYKLAPNLFAISRGTATFGGTFSTSKVEFDEHDAGITSQDVAFVSAVSQQMGLKFLSEIRDLPYWGSTSAPACYDRQGNKGKPMPPPMAQGGLPPQQGGVPPQHGGEMPSHGGYNPMMGGGGNDDGGYNPMMGGGGNDDEGFNPMMVGGNDDGGHNPMMGGGDNDYPTEGVEDDDSRPKRNKDGKKKGKKKRKNGRRGGKGKGVRRKPKRNNRRNRRPSRCRGNRCPRSRNRRPSRGNRRPSRGNRRNPVRKKANRRKKSRGGRGKGRRNRRGRGSRKLRGHGNKLFPTTDSSHLSRKCFVKVCPMIACRGKLFYMDAKDCCGTCSSPYRVHIPFTPFRL